MKQRWHGAAKLPSTSYQSQMDDGERSCSSSSYFRVPDRFEGGNKFRQMLSVGLWNPFPRTARSMMPGGKHSERNLVKDRNILTLERYKHIFVQYTSVNAPHSSLLSVICTVREDRKNVSKKGGTPNFLTFLSVASSFFSPAKIDSPMFPE